MVFIKFFLIFCIIKCNDKSPYFISPKNRRFFMNSILPLFFFKQITENQFFTKNLVPAQGPKFNFKIFALLYYLLGLNYFLLTVTTTLLHKYRTIVLNYSSKSLDFMNINILFVYSLCKIIACTKSCTVRGTILSFFINTVHSAVIKPVNFAGILLLKIKYITYNNTISACDIINLLKLFILRKTKCFNKGRYSRNRQNYRTGFY